jgi:hypothetical protein
VSRSRPRLPVTVSNFLRSPGRDTANALLTAVENKRRARARERNPRVNREPDGPAPSAEVVVYFAEDYRRIYQLEQWLPVLVQLHRRHRVLIVVRRISTLDALRELTDVPAVYVRRLSDVLALYDELDPKAGIYVNNGVANFQSLAVATMLHVHVNHGESDKVSMVSNQAKAYDRVFVAGEAAVRRHAAALIDFDEARLVRVGRPQLDLRFPPALPETGGRTVIYAPTWEGENDFNNYTSVDLYGVAIVTQLLATPGVRVVYRPHPRIETSTTPEVLGAHQEIIRMLDAAARQDPDAGHAISMAGSILALFQHCDAMVTDVSSVGLDFLYLNTERPIFITDRRNDAALLAADAPISTAADVIDARSIATFGGTLAARLEDDVRRADRARSRQFYFGDLAPGESTQRFLTAVADIVALRDELLAKLPPGHGHAHATGAAAAVGDMRDDDAGPPADAELASGVDAPVVDDVPGPARATG